MPTEVVQHHGANFEVVFDYSPSGGRIVTDFDGMVRLFARIAERQERYIYSRALNDVAFLARKAIPGHLRETFTVRRPWTERSLRVNNAEKNRLEAEVGFEHAKAPYMVSQADGGKEESDVPYAIRKRQTQALGAAQWVKTLLDDADLRSGSRRGRIGKRGGRPAPRLAFKAPIKSGSPEIALWRRKDLGHAHPLVLLYKVAAEIQIPPRWDQDGATWPTIDHQFEACYERRFWYVVNTEAKQIMKKAQVRGF